MNSAEPRRHFTAWLNDALYRRFVKNAGWLGGGSLLSALLGLVSVTIMARSLGPDGLGILTLIMVYCNIIDRLLNFQSWQFLIKNGADALRNNEGERLRRQIKFSILLDVSSSLCSTLVAIALAGLAGRLLGWSSIEIQFTMVYALTILFHLSGMPTGLLRLLDRFRALAVQKVVTAVSTLLGTLVAWAWDGGLAGFLIAFGVGNVIGSLYLLGAGLLSLRELHLGSLRRTPLRGLLRDDPGTWQFVFYTNIESSIKILREIDIFIIKVILSAEAVGLYTLGRRLAEIPYLMIDPFVHAIYPEIARLASRKAGPETKRLVLQSSLSLGIAAILTWTGFMLVGPWLIDLLFGSRYSEAYAIAAVCMIGSILYAFSQPASPLLYSLGGARDALLIHAATATLYILMVPIFSSILGTIGASIAYAGFFLAWAISATLASKMRFNAYPWCTS